MYIKVAESRGPDPDDAVAVGRVVGEHLDAQAGGLGGGDVVGRGGECQGVLLGEVLDAVRVAHQVVVAERGDPSIASAVHEPVHLHTSVGGNCWSSGR